MVQLLATIRRQFERWSRPRPLGERGEAAASRFLRRQGYIIIARGQRDRLGEIDLVAVEGRVVVFVEVKTRQTTAKGHPADAVEESKQRRLTRLALSYLKRHELLEQQARFDIISVIWPDGQRRPGITHFKNAFEPTGQWQMFS